MNRVIIIQIGKNIGIQKNEGKVRKNTFLIEFTFSENQK